MTNNHLNPLLKQLLEYFPKNKSAHQTIIKFADSFRLKEKELSSIKDLDADKKNAFLNDYLIILKKSSEDIESLKQVLSKKQADTQEILDLAFATRDQEIRFNNLTYRQAIKDFDHKCLEIQSIHEQTILQAKLTFNRAIDTIDKEANQSRKNYTRNTQIIEEEHLKEKAFLTNKYQNEREIILKIIEEKENETLNKIAEIENQKSVYMSETDQHYYDIKSTYAKMGIQTNNKINYEKKEAAKILQKLEKNYQNKLLPFEAMIAELNEKKQQMQNEIVRIYGEKLKSLNLIFDLQKSDYEEKKLALYKKLNEDVSVYNSQLSSYKEGIALEKKKLQKPSKSSIEDDLKFVEKKRKIDDSDLRLNRFILITNKNIHQVNKNYQLALFEHEKNHLKQINEWRLRRVIYENEYKESLQLLSNQIECEKEKIILEQSKETILYDYQVSLVKLTHNHDLISLEHQILNAASIQDRDINVLGAEVQYRQIHFKTLIEKINYEANLFLEEKKLSIKILDSNYDLKSKINSIQSQLNLEKERIIKNYLLKEVNLKKELQTSIFNYQQTTESLKKDVLLLEVKYEQDVLKEKHVTNNEIKKFTTQMNQLEQQLQLLIEQANYQQNAHHIQVKKVIDIYENELLTNQDNLYRFYQYFLAFHFLIQQITETLNQISHTEHYHKDKNFSVGIFIQLIESIQARVLEDTKPYQAFDLSYYQKKIDDITGFQFRTKHEALITDYDSDILAIEERIEKQNKQIKRNQSNILQLSGGLAKYEANLNALIQDYQNLNKITFDQKKQFLTQKKQFYKAILKIKKQIRNNEKSLTKNNKIIESLRDEKIQRKKLLTIQEEKIEGEKRFEASIFYERQSKHQQYFDTLFTFHTAFYEQVLLTLNHFMKEEFVTDQAFELFYKKLVNLSVGYATSLTDWHQKVLSHIKGLYDIVKNDQEKLAARFDFSIAKHLKLSNESYQLNSNNLTLLQEKYLQEKSELENQLKATFLSQKFQLEKSLQLDENRHKDHILSLEQQILNNSSLSEKSLAILQENQNAVILDFTTECQNLIKQETKSYQKLLTNLNNQNKKAEINLKDWYESTQLKMNSLLRKHDHYAQQLRKTREDKMRVYLSSMDQLKKIYEDSLDNAVKNIAEVDLTIVSSKKKSKQSLVLLEQKQTKLQRSEYLSNLQELKKSHRFKLRQLKLK